MKELRAEMKAENEAIRNLFKDMINDFEIMMTMVIQQIFTAQDEHLEARAKYDEKTRQIEREIQSTKNNSDFVTNHILTIGSSKLNEVAKWKERQANTEKEIQGLKAQLEEYKRNSLYTQPTRRIEIPEANGKTIQMADHSTSILVGPNKHRGVKGKILPDSQEDEELDSEGNSSAAFQSASQTLITKNHADTEARVGGNPLDCVLSACSKESGYFNRRGAARSIIHIIIAAVFGAFLFTFFIHTNSAGEFLNQYLIFVMKHWKSHRWKYRNLSKKHPSMIITILLLLLFNSCNAQPISMANSLSIWMLNVCGGHNPLKMDTIHTRIMQGQLDIFILTETQSNGDLITRNWDWRDYQIWETKGMKVLNRVSLQAGVLIGIKRHIPIVIDHKEIPSMEGRVVAMTVKMVIKNKGIKFKVIGMYAPIRTLEE